MPMLQLMHSISWRALRRKAGVSLLALSMLAPQAAQACTSFLLRTTDKGAVYGRTMEFGFELESRPLVIPRNYSFTSEGPDDKPMLSWKGKYAAVGLNAVNLTALIDGLNEKGLAGGVLYFPGFAEYADASKTDPAKSLAPWDFLTWALTNYATVEEVKAAVNDVSVVGVMQETLKDVPPFHYTLHDATGASIVIEPVDGKLKVYDNPLGVMTNSPSFDWHLINLGNYVKLSPGNVPPLKIGDVTIEPLGQGSGLLGIPGDPTPPSRFVRAIAYILSVQQQPSGPESVRLAEHILNNFDIPKGAVGKGDEIDYTQWSSIADLDNLTYYVKTYDNQILRAIDLKGFNLDGIELLTTTLTPEVTPTPIAPAAFAPSNQQQGAAPAK
ncbi:choloylglycine hydrolase family protein [Pseudochelatococcus contaminans]|uniref:Choloylglycine hydrolase n=1 Tax=Pseudochelatococcus contaminans TaxID=1538103 RepID=A0A7W5Z2N7_9HYPH|nr:choloylglycine hydrolase [Pseudochelatococcus contaminans]